MMSKQSRPKYISWLLQAESDLRSVVDLIKNGHFAQASFNAQQGAEKALKALAFCRGAGTFGKLYSRDCSRGFTNGRGFFKTRETGASAMSCLIYDQSQYQLSSESLKKILESFQAQLKGRVDAAYIFGSASSGNFTKDSDIDLILIHNKTKEIFLHRNLEFSDLYDIFPKLDLLVYTQKEFEDQLADSDVGFWKSVRLSLRRML